MKTFWIGLISLLSVSLPAEARQKSENGMEILVGVSYSGESSSFTATNGGDATFKGSVTTGNALIKFVTPSNYGLGLLFSGGSRKGENNSNSGTTTESLTGSSFDVGVRFYALDLFLGAKVNFSPFTVNYNSPTTGPVSTSYKSIGVGLSLGMDLFLGNVLHFTPKVELTTGSALPESGAASSKRFTNYGLGLGVGLAF